MLEDMQEPYFLVGSIIEINEIRLEFAYNER